MELIRKNNGGMNQLHLCIYGLIQKQPITCSAGILNDVAQSKQYLLHSVELEYGINPQDDGQPQNEEISQVMYWGGYIFMYISLDENIKPCELQKRYNINRVLQCYDIFHSLSVAVAADEIRKEFIC